MRRSSKKRIVSKAATLLTAVFLVCSISTLLFASPYEKYKGTTLVVNFPAHPHYDAVAKVLPEFTRKTGIKVEVDKLQYMRMHEKQLLEMSKPGGDYDLIAYVVFWKTEYAAKGLIEPLGPFFLDPKLADPNYDPDDLIQAYVENIGLVGGKKGYLPGPTAALYGVPFGSETSVLGYRKDVFDKHHLKVPKTYAEMMEIVHKIPKLEPGMAGLTSRGQAGHQVVHAWLLHMAPLGGRIFDDQWNPIFNNAAGVKAAKTLKEILKNGPEGGTSFGFSEMKNAFLQGKSAMFLDSLAVAGEVNDPAKSKVVGKVGWAMHPKGVRRGSQTGGFGVAIPSNSKNKEAAFLLLQWLTSKDTDKKIAMAGGSPSRFSTYHDAALKAKFPYYPTFGEALKYADPDWRPIIPEWGELNAPNFGVAISEAVTGQKPVKKALDDLVPRVRGIMEKAGYYTWQ